MLVLIFRHEKTVGLLAVSSDAATELVKLSESKSFGVFDDHDGGVRNVNADFYDGGGDEYVKFLIFELVHDVVFFLGFHFPVKKTDFLIFKNLANSFVLVGDTFGFNFAGFIDEGTNPKYLVSFGDF